MEIYRVDQSLLKAYSLRHLTSIDSGVLLFHVHLAENSAYDTNNKNNFYYNNMDEEEREKELAEDEFDIKKIKGEGILDLDDAEEDLEDPLDVDFGAEEEEDEEPDISFRDDEEYAY